MKQVLQADYLKAFKPADIRGQYPKEIDEELVYFVARAFVDEYKLSEVVVGRDMRLSTPALFSAFCKGVQDAGADVLDIGLVATPMMYFVSGFKQMAGVMITASHSPKQFNGLKLVLPGAIPLTDTCGLTAIRKRIERGKFTDPVRVGKTRVKDFKKAYQSYVFKAVAKKNLTGLKVAVDCGNGMGSVLVSLWAEKLPVTFTTLFTELDGRFPNRGSDPTLKKNQRAISHLLAEGGHNFGVALDGDSDRIAFFDERGRYVNSAIIGAIAAEVLLAQSPGEKIIYTTLTSRILKDSILKAGGVPVLARVGHAFIKETMRKEGVLFGAEHSGHFYFKDYFYTDSVTLTLRAVLTAYGEAKRAGLTFSEFIAPYQVYYQTEDTIAPAAKPEATLEAVRTFLVEQKPKQLKRYDGYMVDFGDVWGSVKVSVTEPALKFMFESQSKARAESVKKSVQTFITQFEKGSQDA